MSAETYTDISGLVNGAFDEMECCGDPQKSGPHEGDHAAFYNGHGCLVGLLCAGHLKRLVDVKIPLWRQHFQSAGAIRCLDCGEVFQSMDTWMRVFPL